jgi:hypothetical protein
VENKMKPELDDTQVKSHDLYKDGDENIPEVILDRNGQVVLSVCKICRETSL